MNLNNTALNYKSMKKTKNFIITTLMLLVSFSAFADDDGPAPPPVEPMVDISNTLYIVLLIAIAAVYFFNKIQSTRSVGSSNVH